MAKLIAVPRESVDNLRKQKQDEVWGFKFVSVKLKDGRCFPQAIESEGCIIEVKGHKDVPFNPEDVETVTATDKRWNFRKRQKGELAKIA